MSRIGKKPIVIPKGVTIQADATGVDVKGPKGQMKQALPPRTSPANTFFSVGSVLEAAATVLPTMSSITCA